MRYNSRMRTRRGPALLGMSVLVYLLVTGCSRPTTPMLQAWASPRPADTATSVSPQLTPTASSTVSPTPRDGTAPSVTLGDVPAQVQPAEGLKVIASASDDIGVTRMTLTLAGALLHETAEGSLRYNLDTRLLSPGSHVLVVTAWDASGNEGRAALSFVVAAPQPAPSATTARPDPTATLTPTVVASATTAPSPTAIVPTPAPTVQAVTATWGEISIPTYGYKQALYLDPDGSGQPYPLLHRDQVTGPVDTLYRVLVLRNAWLELQLLPELGGRIYQCRFLPTGQDLLYNNRAIKPTQWGPTDQGWWLAVGGIEFCLPVDEHGYLTAEPWDTELLRAADGSATAVMSIVERSRNLRAEVRVTLRPGEAGIGLQTAITNLDGGAKSFQYWTNAMLSPGSHGVQPSLRFYFPTDAVTVHSRGDGALPDAGATMPWPVYDGRDLSHYATWRNWLGFFAPDLTASYTAVYDSAARIGMVRSFAPGEAPGAKLFGFGQGFDPGVYTDDGTQYVEMWGGLTPTFWDYATLGANERRTCEEFWYVLVGLDGLTTANERAVLYVQREAAALRISVASPGAGRWMLSVLQDGREIAQWPCETRPDAPVERRLEEGAWNPSAAVDVRVLDVAGQVVLAHTG